MKKLMVFAMCILMLMGCKKEYSAPSVSDKTPEKRLQDIPKCGNDLNEEFAAKMLKARRSRDEKEKISARKPKFDSDSIPTHTVIFIDVDGQIVENTTWNFGGRFDCLEAGLTADQLNAIIRSVTEDFSPFQITITADENLFNNTAKEKRVRVVITKYQGLENVFPPAGGYAFVGSLGWTDDSPCFVFADAFGWHTANIAEAVSHEVGHTIGLGHQAEYYSHGGLKYHYHSGFVFGPPWNVTWRAIMGSGYNGDISGWMSGRTVLGTQNDFQILSTVGVKADEVPNILSTARQLKFNGPGKKVVFTELINRQTDVDCYLVGSGNIKFSVIGYGNCDLQVFVYNGTQRVIADFNDQNGLGISEKTINTKGNRIYLMVVANNFLDIEIQSAGQYTLVVNKI